MSMSGAGGSVASREAAVPRSLNHLAKSVDELKDRLSTLCVRLEPSLQNPPPPPPTEHGSGTMKEPTQEACSLSVTINNQTAAINAMIEMVENWLRRIEL